MSSAGGSLLTSIGQSGQRQHGRQRVLLILVCVRLALLMRGRSADGSLP